MILQSTETPVCQRGYLHGSDSAAAAFPAIPMIANTDEFGG